MVEAIRPRIGAYGELDERDLKDAVAAGRAQGYAAIGEKAVPGVTAIGLAVRNPFGAPVAALAIAAISSRMTPARQAALFPLLAQRSQCNRNPLVSVTPCDRNEHSVGAGRRPVARLPIRPIPTAPSRPKAGSTCWARQPARWPGCASA